MTTMRRAASGLYVPRSGGGGGGSGFSAAVLALTGLQAYWRLGDTSGTTAVDASPNGRNGTYQNGTVLNQPSLLSDGSGKSAQFDGVDDRVALAYAAWMGGWSGLTVLGLVKLSALGSYRTIAARDAAGSFGPWRLRITNGNKAEFLFWPVSSSSPTVVTGTTSLTTGTTYLVVGTWDGSTVRVYLNATNEASAARSAASFNADTPELRIGTYGNSSTFGEIMNGYLQEVAVCNAAISGSDVSNLNSLK